LYTAADSKLGEGRVIKNENFQNSRWRTAAILKIVISPYLSEKSSDFDQILYTAADFELDEGHVIKNEKIALDRLRVRQNVFLVLWRHSFDDDDDDDDDAADDDDIYS